MSCLVVLGVVLLIFFKDLFLFLDFVDFFDCFGLRFEKFGFVCFVLVLIGFFNFMKLENESFCDIDVGCVFFLVVLFLLLLF